MSSNNLKDIFSYRAFARVEGDGQINDEELKKLEAFMVIMQNSATLKDGIKTYFTNVGISESKCYILLLLNEKNEELMTPSEIAEFLSLSRGTISDLIDSMEKEKLLERVMCKNDRRKIQVTITEEGKGVIEGILPQYYKLTSELMSCLNTNEVKILVDITQKLSENMKKVIETNKSNKN